MTDYISLDLIRSNPYQPRVTMETDALKELAESISHTGLMQEPTVRRTADGHYELAFGHRRAEAVRLLELFGDTYMYRGEEVELGKLPVTIVDLTNLQMFEMAIAENMKRRDLNPIETAEALRHYMNDFHKSSAEAAEFFYMTPEAVRGTIRLLNLPEGAKQAVREGTVNVTAARQLLTLQGIAGVEAVEEVAHAISNNGGTVSPADEIESAFQDNAQHLTPDSAWFAPKKFPLKHLSPIEKKDVSAALDGNPHYTAHPETEKTDVAEIHKLITAGMEVSGEAFPHIDRVYLERVRALANPPACTSCELHAQINNSHYCGFDVCMKRKQAAWRAKEDAETSKQVGVPLYTPEDGKTGDMFPWKDADKELFASKHADLRLSLPKNQMYSNFDGLGANLQLVAVGALMEARHAEEHGKKNNESTEDAKQKRKELRERATREGRHVFFHRFMWEVVSRSFSDLVTGTWDFLLFQQVLVTQSTNADFPDDLDEDGLLQEAIAEYDRGMQVNKVTGKKMLGRLISHCMLDDRFFSERINLFAEKEVILEAAKIVSLIADEWGVKLSASFDADVTRYQADMEAAIKEAVKDIK